MTILQEFFELGNFAHATLFQKCDHVWEALGLIGDYLESLELGKIEGEVSKDAYLVNPELISIGEGSVVEPGAYIKGPCVIGKNSTVRHAAYIRGNVIAGDNCMIGHCTEVKNAIFLDEAQAGHFAYVGDSILGNRVNLGAGVKLANLRFDHKTIRGLRKFGAIIGDDAQIGCNAVTNPGTLISKGTLCRPNTTIK